MQHKDPLCYAQKKSPVFNSLTLMLCMVYTHVLLCKKTTLYTNLRLMSPCDPALIIVQEVVVAPCLPTRPHPGIGRLRARWRIPSIWWSVRKFRNKGTPRCVCLDRSHCAQYRSDSTTCAGVWVPTAMEGAQQPDRHIPPKPAFRAWCERKRRNTMSPWNH